MKSRKLTNAMLSLVAMAMLVFPARAQDIGIPDPDFDANQKAFYYTRVLEIPTPCWVVYDKVRLGAEIPEGAELTLQERAYTSPIWYTP